MSWSLGARIFLSISNDSSVLARAGVSAFPSSFLGCGRRTRACCRLAFFFFFFLLEVAVLQAAGGAGLFHCRRRRVVKKVGLAGGDEGDVGAATRLCVAQLLAAVVLDLHGECPSRRPELILSLDPKLLGHGPLLLIISLPAVAPGILLLHEGNVPRDGIIFLLFLVLVVIRFLKKKRGISATARIRLRLGLGLGRMVVEVDGLDEAAEGVVGLGSGGGDVAEPGRKARGVGLGGDGPSEREEVVLDLGPELVVLAAEEGEQGRAVVGEEQAMQLRREIGAEGGHRLPIHMLDHDSSSCCSAAAEEEEERERFVRGRRVCITNQSSRKPKIDFIEAEGADRMFFGLSFYWADHGPFHPPLLFSVPTQEREERELGEEAVSLLLACQSSPSPSPAS
uniref:Uncharacterized protein n=1 Tax=Oryza nivara TaxID=4536 RepID=A0A0E0I633_ORYNI